MKGVVKLKLQKTLFISLLMLAYIFSGCTSVACQCHVEGCRYSAIEGGEYCNSHTCKIDGCTQKREVDTNYCSQHICEATNCSERKATDSQFCSKHTCIVSDCAQQASTNNYCATHYNERQHELNMVVNKAVEDAKQAIVDEINSLSFANITATANTVYTEISADLSNNGSKTFYYVQVKGIFYDSSNNIVNTDWTYAVGSEGLAPGETKNFSMLVPNCHDFSSVSLSILDYQ